MLVETKGTTGEETISYWFDLPIDVAEFEEKLGIGAESQDYRIIEKVLPFADEIHEHTSVYQLNELDFMYRQLSSDMQEEYTALLTVYEDVYKRQVMGNVYHTKEEMIDCVNACYEGMVQRSEEMKRHPNYKTGENYAYLGLPPCFLIFDEYVAFFEMLGTKERCV